MSLLSSYDLETFHQHILMKLQNIKTTSISVLEDLSNELLIYIFSFLSPYDLHRGLYNLNSRLNSVCYSQKLCLDLSCTRRVFDYYSTNQKSFALQIYNLKLDDSYGRLILFNQYNNIELFTNLRKLTIKEPFSENLDKILPKLSLLPYLSYLNIQSASMQSSHRIVNIFQIRTLKCLILYSIKPISFHFDQIHIQPLTELEYMEINDCYTLEFLKLLEYIGTNVRRMKIRMSYNRQQNTIAIDQLLINPIMPILMNRIVLNFYFLSLVNFHLILQLFPNLTHLTFSTLTNDIDFILPSIWYEFISTYLSKLKQLKFYIQIQGPLGNVIQYPSTEFIDSFYTMNHQWLVGSLVVDYNSLLIPPLLEIYTHPQSKSLRKYSVQLYGTQRYILPTILHPIMHVDEQITTLNITLTDNYDITSTDGTNIICPKVTNITINSKMTRTSIENDKKINLIISNILQSIPDLSKVTSINFNPDSSLYLSTTLARRLFDKLIKFNRLALSYTHLLLLLKSPLIVNILSRKIGTLRIIFDADIPVLLDIIRILKIFSKNLRFLYLNIVISIPPKKFYFILPLLFSGICQKLYGFQLVFSITTRQEIPIFDEALKLRFRQCLNAQIGKDKTKYGQMEYKIKDNELSISF